MHADLDDIIWTTDSFVTKLSVVMHHHELECHAENSFCLLQGQYHSEGSCKQNKTFSYSELLSILQPDLVLRYIIISQSVLWNSWITVFKVKATAKVKNFRVFFFFA